jgi:hypothetical protein
MDKELQTLLGQEHLKMAKKLSEVYDWDYDELVAMEHSALRDTYSERYLDYIYGI